MLVYSIYRMIVNRYKEMKRYREEAGFVEMNSKLNHYKFTIFFSFLTQSGIKIFRTGSMDKHKSVKIGQWMGVQIKYGYVQGTRPRSSLLQSYSLTLSMTSISPRRMTLREKEKRILWENRKLRPRLRHLLKIDKLSCY